MQELKENDDQGLECHSEILDSYPVIFEDTDISKNNKIQTESPAKRIKNEYLYLSSMHLV